VTLEQLVGTAEPRLRAFFAARVPPDDVDDLVQETLTLAVGSWHRFEGRSSPLTWVYGIGKNLLKAWYRRRSPSSFDAEPPTRDRFEDRIDTADLIERIAPRLRSLYFLRYERDLSVAEIAAFWRIPEGTVKYRLYELRNEVRRAMG
jgi:RNA polymerase sigma factor (sigma-70 family)